MSNIKWTVEELEVQSGTLYSLPIVEVRLSGTIDGYLSFTGKTVDDITHDIEAKLNGPVKPDYVPYSRMSDKYYLYSNAERAVKIIPDSSRSIKNVIFNDPATIVFWGDGTKTVVKCGEDDIFDPEKGLAMAISKKFFGNQGNYYNEIKKWVEPENKQRINHVIEEFARLMGIPKVTITGEE